MAIKATRIKMKNNCFYSDNLLEIDQIYLEGCDTPGYYSKEIIHDFLIGHPNSIEVNIFPYPDLQPMVSVNGEKFVRSIPNQGAYDNLLRLPRD